MKPSLDDIRETIIGVLKEMLEEWGIEDEPIQGSSFLQGDLGFSSVDALQVMATLDLRLGTKLPYEKLVMPDGEYVNDITVNQLAEFADQHFYDVPSGPIAM